MLPEVDMVDVFEFVMDFVFVEDVDCDTVGRREYV